MSTTIDIYLNKIASALWQGRAALMVGAGLSREADRTSDAVPKFPLWSELKNKICTDLGCPKEDQTDVLALASQYEALLGRPELEMFLRREIPDMDFSPGVLHGKLMKLPWTDIFTTNYDSLLERADAKYAGSAYDLVQTNDDIAVCRKGRRIVKLHGTFAIAGSFVFTEEDYRTYPNTHAPFVNMVQEAMMENTFCLLGFSGTDINFLRWLGWVHDNLGAMMPRIYLCGILNLSEAQRKDFDKKNVALVDLSEFASEDEYPDADDRHKKAIGTFLEELKKRKPASPMDWCSRDFAKTTNWEILREERQNYPGWVIMPYEVRERHGHFLHHCRPFINRAIVAAEPWEKLCIAYELNWHIEQQLEDIYPKEEEIYLAALLNANPFPNCIKLDGAVVPSEKDAHRLAMWREAWVGLAFILTRWAREHGKKDLWKQLMQYLGQINHLSELWKMQWHYEKCKEALFGFSWDTVLDELQEWNVPEQYPYWQLQKASLYAGLDKLDDADRLVSTALAEIRSRYRGSDTNHTQLQSWEGWGLYLLLRIRNARLPNKGSNQDEIDRWREIAARKGNPQVEISHLSNCVQQQKRKTNQTTKLGFDPGHETIEYSFSSVPWWNHSFSWLRLHDLAPLPVRCGMSLVDATADSRAAEDLWSLRSVYATEWILQFMHAKDVDGRYTRLAVALLSNEEVDKIYDSCMNSFQQLDAWMFGESKNSKKAWGNSFARERLTEDLEIISRLCFRLNQENLDEVFALAVHCYNSPLFQYNESYAQILGKLWQRLLLSMSLEQLNICLLTLLRLPILGEAGFVVHVSPQSWPEPSAYLGDAYGGGLCDVERQENWDLEIERLTRLATDHKGELRKRALWRLMPLYFGKLLTDTQIDNLAKAIWSCLGSDELPADMGYFIGGVTAWPGANQHNAMASLHKALLARDLNVDARSVKQYCLELMYASRGTKPADTHMSDDSKEIIWSGDELHTLLQKTVECVNRLAGEVSDHGQPDLFGASAHAKQAIQQAGQWLLQGVVPFVQLKQEEKDSMLNLCGKLKQKNLFPISLQLALLLHDEHDYKQAAILLRNGLNSYVDEDVTEAYEGMLHWLRCYGQKMIDESLPEDLLLSCSQNLESRRSPGLITGLNHLGFIMKEFPAVFSDGCLAHLCAALEHLQNEAQLYGAFMPGLPEALGLDQSEWPRLQYASARFSKTVHDYYEAEKKTEPPIIDKWRNMCRDSVLPEVWHLAW